MSGADGDTIDRADGRDLRRRTGEEDLIGHIQTLARYERLPHRVAGVLGQRDGAASGDPLQDGGGQRWRDHVAAAHHKEILAAALADEAIGIQGNPLRIAVPVRLHGDQLRVDVLPTYLGRSGERAGRHAPPRTHAHVHALLNRLRPQITPPFDGDDSNLHWTRCRIDAEGVESSVDQGANVAGIELVGLDRLQDRLPDLLLGVRDLHAIDLGRVEQTVDVSVKAEHRGASLCRIGPYALKHAGAVVQDVRRDVDLRLIPRGQLTIEPDRRALLHRHYRLLTQVVDKPFATMESLRRLPWSAVVPTAEKRSDVSPDTGLPANKKTPAWGVLGPNKALLGFKPTLTPSQV